MKERIYKKDLTFWSEWENAFAGITICFVEGQKIFFERINGIRKFFAREKWN